MRNADTEASSSQPSLMSVQTALLLVLDFFAHLHVKSTCLADLHHITAYRMGNAESENDTNIFQSFDFGLSLTLRSINVHL